MPASLMPTSLIAWLEEISREINCIEEEAKETLNKPDYQADYRKLMLRKTRLLESLPEKYVALVRLHPDWKKQDVEKRLGDFAGGAQTALSLDSLFYMSALLYPDEHKAGEPNNLERLIAGLR